MSLKYEDEFMDLQSGLISLCMEITKGKVDYIFVYCSNEKSSKFFNAFFAKDGKLIKLHQLDASDSVQWRFLDLGLEDLCKLDALGEKHNTSVPTEIKMGYQVASGKLRATYKYEPVCVDGVSSDDVYAQWMAQVKKGFKLE